MCLHAKKYYKRTTTRKSYIKFDCVSLLHSPLAFCRPKVNECFPILDMILQSTLLTYVKISEQYSKNSLTSDWFIEPFRVVEAIIISEKQLVVSGHDIRRGGCMAIELLPRFQPGVLPFSFGYGGNGAEKGWVQCEALAYVIFRYFLIKNEAIDDIMLSKESPF